MRPPVPGWPQSVPRSAGLPEQSGSSRSGCPVVSCLSPSTLSFCFVYAGRPLAGARLSMTVPCCRALAPRAQEMDVFSEILIPTPVVSDSLGLCLRAVPSSPPPTLTVSLHVTRWRASFPGHRGQGPPRPAGPTLVVGSTAPSPLSSSPRGHCEAVHTPRVFSVVPAGRPARDEGSPDTLARMVARWWSSASVTAPTC